MSMRSNSFTSLDIPRFGAGVLDTGFGVFIILIAIRFLNAPDYYKAALSGGGSIGLILTPVYLFYFLKNTYRRHKGVHSICLAHQFYSAGILL